MKIYDSLIREVNSLLEGKKLVSLPLSDSYPEEEGKAFIFANDTAVELGGNSSLSSYLMSYTANEDIVSKDEIFLLGKPLNELGGDVPFAHICFVLLQEEDKKDQDVYRMLRDIEYSRYKVNPKGYMVRINTNYLKEGGRVSKQAIKDEMSFTDIGSSFLRQFKKMPSVKAVKQIFVTDPSFDYKRLNDIEKEMEGVTLALDHILKTLKMDCRACSFKDICDTVEGMRELHKKETN